MIRYALWRLSHQFLDPWQHVTRNTRTVRDLAALKQALGWSRDPRIEGDYFRQYGTDSDLNDRRLRDAEVIAAACANAPGGALLEIGTAHGYTTALMAENAPHATVHTVNIPPEEIERGGTHVTFAPSRDETGHVYRAKGLTNVKQIFANTATWSPDFGPIDVAFIDGCHDADFVFNDTRKTLARCRPGSIVLWHDFNPDLSHAHDWMAQVCLGIERLYAKRLIRGRILHLRDSWVGLYRVPG